MALIAGSLIACNSSESENPIKPFVERFPNFKVVVLEFYTTEGKLPTVEHERQIKAATGFWQELTIEGSGRYRFDLTLRNGKKLPIIIVAAKGKYTVPPVDFQCFYRDDELKKYLDEGGFKSNFDPKICQYRPDLPVKQAAAEETKNQVDDNKQLLTAEPQRYRQELNIDQIIEIEHCFKKWGITWKSPYAIDLSGSCETESSANVGKSLYFTGDGQKTILQLNPHSNPMLDLKYGRGMANEKETAIYAHFDALFIRQGFKKLANDMPTSANFTRTTIEGTVNANFRCRFANQIELIIEQVRTLKPGINLPSPSDELFNLFHDGRYDKLFLLPQGSFVEEQIVGDTTKFKELSNENSPLFATPIGANLSIVARRILPLTKNSITATLIQLA